MSDGKCGECRKGIGHFLTCSQHPDYTSAKPPKVQSVGAWMEAVREGHTVTECRLCGWTGEKFPVHMLTCELKPPDEVA